MCQFVCCPTGYSRDTHVGHCLFACGQIRTLSDILAKPLTRVWSIPLPPSPFLQTPPPLPTLAPFPPHALITVITSHLNRLNHLGHSYITTHYQSTHHNLGPVHPHPLATSTTTTLPPSPTSLTYNLLSAHNVTLKPITNTHTQ